MKIVVPSLFHSPKPSFTFLFLSPKPLNEQTGIAKMSEDGSTTKQVQNLSNLPHDILSSIADGLGLMELMNLRGVCKNWHNVSSKALLKQVHESFEHEPWFLLYDREGSKCSLLLRNRYKICTATIPELEGATCLASYEGWLLVFRGGSMFFFCPFSMAKIDLPSCPFTELSGHAAAFSASPTSQDCNIVVIRRCSDTELELHLLSRGHETWTKHSSYFRVQHLGAIVAALFSEGVFHFRDTLQGLVTFDAAAAAAETPKWNNYRVVRSSEHEEALGSLKYGILRHGNLGSIDFNKLGLDTNRVSISACGTLYTHHRDNGTDEEELIPQVIPNESIEAAIGSESRHLKGVWILPRYHTLSMDHRW